MKPIEIYKTWLNGVDASGGNQNSDFFSLAIVDRVQWEVIGTGPTVVFQHSQSWDANAKAPTNWYDLETQAQAGIYSTNVSTGYGRFVATAGNPVTVKARRMTASQACN